MSSYVTSEIINLLIFLVPGFVTSLIIYNLISFPKRSEFEAIVLALIFTIIIKPIVFMIENILYYFGNKFSFGLWNNNSEIFWSIIIAVVLGITFAFVLNNDIILSFLRNKKITKESSYPSAWYAEFYTTEKYVTLHLKDERRILGWPLKWPTSPEKGHFVLCNAKWLGRDSEADNVDLDSADKILISAKEVEIVEFLKEEGVSNEF